MSFLMPSPRPDADRQPRPTAAAPPVPDGIALATLAFDAVPVALAVTALDGQVVRANQAMCDLLGYPADRLRGHSYRTLTHPEDLPLDEQAAIALLAATGPGPAVEKRFRHADGHLIWARVTATLINGADGAALGAAVVIEDIAERRRRDAEQ
jgi:PAS domain S-box-containing protein